MAGEAEQLRTLGTQPDDLEQHGPVVVRTHRRPLDRRLEQPAAHVAVAQVGQQRLAGRQHQRYEIRPFVPAGPACLGSGGDRLGAEPVQIVRAVDDDRGCLARPQQILLEFRGQHRQSLIQCGQPGPTFAVEPGAGQYEVQVVALDQGDGLGIEGRVVLTKAVHGVQPGEQCGVELDGIVVRGQPRRILGLERPKFRC